MKILHGSRKPGLLLALLALLSVSALAAGPKLEVVARSANVRLRADIDSPVVGHAPEGLVLTALRADGEWYFVQLPPDANGLAVRGYIHKSVVKESGASPASKPAAKSAARAKAPAPRSAARRKMFLRLGAGYGTKTFDYANSWAFDMYGESGHASERYAVDASGVAVDAGFGFMFTPSLGVELSFVPASGKSTGTFDASFPHPFYFGVPREKAWTDDGLKYSSSELNLDLLYAVPVMKRMDLCLFAGGTYVLGVKVEGLKSLNWSESGYPYLDLNVSPQYATYRASAFGFNAGAGLDYRLSPGMAVSLLARYSSASAKVKIEGNEATVPAGGLRATLGLKFGF